ncbi:MAG: SDR family NAD(P)-dependent oxidoreductase [Ilumatobacteraceae bacterium]
MRLSGKVALVTGAAQGIGKAAALRFALEGASVMCADIQESVESTAKEIEAAGGTAAFRVMDTTNAGLWAGTVEATISAFGRVDLLANIAGVVALDGPDTIVGLTEERWDHVVGVDLKGVWMGMRAVIPGMVAQGGGRICNVASMAALRGLPNLAAYSAAKGGVAALTRQAAIEYANDNILVNAVAPGTIDTPILAGVQPEDLAAFAASHAINRLGRPGEIAAMMVHFFSDDGDFLTGQLFPVCGGWSIK